MSKKLTVKDLKDRYLQTFENITFDIVNDKRIPNVAMIGTTVIGQVTLSTINAYNKWKPTVKGLMYKGISYYKEEGKYYCDIFTFTEDNFFNNFKELKEYIDDYYGTENYEG